MFRPDQDLEARAANALVVYSRKPDAPNPGTPASQPDREQVLGKALRFARAALMLWGGFSLAGVAAGGIVYAQGGFGPPKGTPPLIETAKASPVREPGSTPASERAERAARLASAGRRTAEPAPEPQASGSHPVAAVRPVDAPGSDGPKPYQPPTPKRKASAAENLEKPAEAQRAEPSAAAAVLEPSQRHIASPGPTAETAYPATPEARTLSAVPDRLAVARLPQARPKEPATTGSIRRQQHASYSHKRFRRLREMPLPFRYRRRYHEPDYDYPAPPPFFYYR